MSKQGWIALHRKTLDNPLWETEPFTRGQAWIDLLLLANHKEGKIIVRDNVITVERGQVGWSQKRLATRWKWSRTKVRNFLKYLENEQQIIQHKNYVSSLITIVNYNKYQSKGQQTGQQENSKKTARRQQEDTNNNNNNVNNVNKYIYDFKTFWEKYPRKIGKQKVEKIYKRKATSPKKETEIMEGLKKYLRKWRLEETDKQFIPYPSSWLNQERWKDEVEMSRDVYNKFARNSEDKWKETKHKEKLVYSNLRKEDNEWDFEKLSKEDEK